MFAQNLKLVLSAVFVLELVKCSPLRNFSLAKFLYPWKLQHQISFKHILWSKLPSVKFLFKSLTSNKLILEQKSKYLNSIRVFPFFHFIFPLKWNKQEIFNRRHEKDQKQTLQSATLLKKRHSHRCFPVNFAKFFRISFLAETPQVADSERWKTVTPIILHINLFT